MKKLFMIMLFCITCPLYTQQQTPQQYDMTYPAFRNFINEEMTEDEFRSVDNYFEGNIDGIICFYDYGDFSGDTLDELVVLTSENAFEYGQKINVYIFKGTEKGTFEFVDKVTYPYWKSRYEVAILIKRGVLFVTSTDRNYENWKWAVYQVDDAQLKLLREENYR